MARLHLRIRMIGLLFLSAVFLCIIDPHVASAHATLIEANPIQGSHLSESPEEVVLTFNERLGGGVYHLKVYDSDGALVTDEEATLGEQHRSLRVPLPALDDGVYTVSYRVISADGHPIGNSYTFSVGDVQASVANAPAGGHSHGDGGVFLIRIAYYAVLLFLAGMVLWRSWTKQPEEVSRRYRVVSRRLKQAFLLLVLGWGIVEFSALLSASGGKAFVSLFVSTTTGATWLLSFILAVASFWVLGKSRWLDGIWVFLLLAAEAINGHALAFPPNVLTVPLDFIHLFTAAIWAGGLFYIVYFWKKHTDHVRQFLPTFSRAALVSIGVLIVSGVAMTLLFLPSIGDVVRTWWGWLLILKTALVLAVIVTAGFIRAAMKKKGNQAVLSRVRVDFSLLLVIILIVGVFTYINPVPSNKPLIWRETENNITVTTNIAPKELDTSNTITVNIRAPEQPNDVRMYLHEAGDDGIAPIEVPLEATATEGDTTRYAADDFYIPFAGKWHIELRVLDANDDETVFEKRMTVYETITL